MQKVEGIYLPTSDTHFPEMIRKGKLVGGKGTYQLNKLEAALPYAKQKRLAIDVGAHVGLWTRVLAMHFKQVIAYEPVPEHASCLEMNTADLPHVVRVIDCALGANGCIASMETTVGNSGNAHIGTNVHPDRVVPVRALDEVLNPDLHVLVDFIKIDVEGYEYEVVLGAREVIKRAKPVMVVEQKPGNAERYGIKTGGVLALLKSWGASIVWTKSGDYCLTWG